MSLLLLFAGATATPPTPGPDVIVAFGVTHEGIRGLIVTHQGLEAAGVTHEGTRAATVTHQGIEAAGVTHEGTRSATVIH